jgi:hypothetical protein
MGVTVNDHGKSFLSTKPSGMPRQQLESPYDELDFYARPERSLFFTVTRLGQAVCRRKQFIGDYSVEAAKKD